MANYTPIRILTGKLSDIDDTTIVPGQIYFTTYGDDNSGYKGKIIFDDPATSKRIELHTDVNFATEAGHAVAADRATGDQSGQNIQTTYLQNLKFDPTTWSLTFVDGTGQDRVAKLSLAHDHNYAGSDTPGGAANFVKWAKNETAASNLRIPFANADTTDTKAAFNFDTGFTYNPSTGTIVAEAFTGNARTASSAATVPWTGVSGRPTSIVTAIKNTNNNLTYSLFGGSDQTIGTFAPLDTNSQIPLQYLPAAALERLVVVSSLDDMYKLTTSQVQIGDTVQIGSGEMYRVVDDTKLSSAAGYVVYTAGTASKVNWGGIQNRPNLLKALEMVTETNGTNKKAGNALRFTYVKPDGTEAQTTLMGFVPLSGTDAATGAISGNLALASGKTLTVDTISPNSTNLYLNGKVVFDGTAGKYYISDDGTQYTGNAASSTKTTYDSTGTQKIVDTYIATLTKADNGDITYARGNGQGATLDLSANFVNVTGDTMTGDLSISKTDTSAISSLYIKHTTGNAQLVLDRTASSAASYKFINDSGILKIQSDYTTSKGNYFDMFTMAYSTGHTTFKGNVTAPRFIGLADKATADGANRNIENTYFADVLWAGNGASKSSIAFKNGAGTEIKSIDLSANFVQNSGDTMTGKLTISAGGASIAGGLTATGGASITGKTSITGTLGVSDKITGGNGLSITGATTLEGLSAGATSLTSLGVSGASTLNTLTVSSTSNLQGETTIGQANSTATNLKVNGSQTISKNLTITGNLTTNGNTTLGNAAGTDTLTVNAKATLNGSISATNGLTISGGTVDIQVSTTIGNADTDTLTVNATPTFKTAVGIEKSLNVTEDIAAKNITATGALSVSSSATIGGMGKINGGLQVYGTIGKNLDGAGLGLYVQNGIEGASTLKIGSTSTFGGKLTVSTGGASITGNTEIKSGTLTVAKKLTVTSGGLTVTAGGATITAGGLSVAGGGASITGTTSITGALGVSDNATIGGTLGVTGHTSLSTLGVSSNLTVGGTSELKGNVTVGTSAAAASLTVTGKIYGKSNLEIDGTTQLDGKLSITSGGAAITGAVTMSSTLKVDSNTTISGTLGVAGKTTLKTLEAGATTLSSLNVTGTSTLNSLAVTNGISGKTLSITTTSSLLGAVSIGQDASATNLSVIGSQTISKSLTITENLTVNGNTTLGDNIAQDTLTVNAKSTFGADVTFSNTNTAQKQLPGLLWKTIGGNSPYIGYAHDQTDGTFIIYSPEKNVTQTTAKNYRNGLSVGGGSGNLFWKGDVISTQPWADATFLKLTGGTLSGALTINNSLIVSKNITCSETITGKVVKGAVWNDYAEYRKSNELEPGRVVVETGKGNLVLATERLQAGANIISDTFGFAIGETEECECPIAVSGRVLAYPLENKEIFEAGDPVCAGPNGTISKMTRAEVREWPDRIIGTVSEIPDYTYWGTGNVKVNGRIWIKVK